MEAVEKAPDGVVTGRMDVAAIARLSVPRAEAPAPDPPRMPTARQMAARRRRHRRGRTPPVRRAGPGRINPKPKGWRKRRRYRRAAWTPWLCEVMLRANPDAWFSTPEVRAWSRAYGREMHRDYAVRYLRLGWLSGYLQRRDLKPRQDALASGEADVVGAYRLTDAGRLVAVLSRAAMRLDSGAVVWRDHMWRSGYRKPESEKRKRKRKPRKKKPAP